MKCPAIPPDEPERIRSLTDHGLDDERLVPNLDPVVRIASRMFNMPVAAVNMIGSDHVFFAASHGIETADMRRDVSFCAHAINQSGVMVVPDTTRDERFHDNPLVTGATQVRFYAGAPLFSPDGHALGALCILDSRPHADFSPEDGERLKELARMASDRLELRRIEVSSARSRPAFADHARDSATPVAWLDEAGRILAWNEAAASLFGYDVDAGAGLAFDTLFAPEAAPLLGQLRATATERDALEQPSRPQVLAGRRRDGASFVLQVTLLAWRQDGERRYEAILQQATGAGPGLVEQPFTGIDLLTGLATRGSFYRSAEEVLLRPAPVAALVVDLDGFKDINGSMGHAVGDEVLRQIGARLRALASRGDVIARVGGDEFALLLAAVADTDTARHRAQAVIDRIREPIHVERDSVCVAASCGVALAPPHAQEALELVGDADLALFQAKRAGRGRVAMFAPALRREAAARRQSLLELHRAVDRGELVLHYQPQFDLASGALRGAEALIRWQHPVRGLLSPAAFLPALESGPLAMVVGDWILDEACAQAAYWIRCGIGPFRVGVNLFEVQLRAGDLDERVLAALARHGLPPQSLEIEITENIVLGQDDAALTTLHRLRSAGVGVAFDDFGTGYASLSLLKTYPLSRIKIDRSFVQGMLDSPRDASVVRAILDMTHSFGLETIAEGIETGPQQEYLRERGCQEGQGFFYARPLSAADFSARYQPQPSQRRA